MEIGFIGLGVMGMPMLERLCSCGYNVHFYGRKPETVELARKLGASSADSVAQLAGSVEILILCVYSDQQVRELTLAPGGIADTLKPGGTLIIHTTGSPATASEIATLLSSRSCDLLDAPVSGGPHNIRAGSITLLAGGDADTLERCKPLLSAYGNPILHTGPTGSGQAVKLVNNLLFAANVDLIAEASRILTELKIEQAMALKAIGHCSGDSSVLQMVLRTGCVSKFKESAGKFIAKDRFVAKQVTDQLGIDTGLLGIQDHIPPIRANLPQDTVFRRAPGIANQVKR